MCHPTGRGYINTRKRTEAGKLLIDRVTGNCQMLQMTNADTPKFLLY